MRNNIESPFQGFTDRGFIAGSLGVGLSDQISKKLPLTDVLRQQAIDRAFLKFQSNFDNLKTGVTSSKPVFLKRFSRSSITVNPSDDSGWRKPSAYSATWADDVIVDYRQGKYAYYRIVVTITRSTYNHRYHAQISGQIGVADFQLPLSIPLHSGPSSNAENRLLASALSQLRNQKFNLALAVLEGKETLRTLRGLIEKLRAIMQAIRKKDLSHLQRAFGFVTKNRNAKGVYTKGSSDLWLEANYGVAPIVYDIYGLCELFEQQVREAGFRIAVRSKISYRDSETITPTTDEPIQGFVSGKLNVIHDVTQKVALWYELDAENLHLAEALGLTNPLLWVWEKTTLSFVVDWVLPLGDVLAGLSSDLGFKYLGGTHTYFSRSHGYGTLGAFAVPAMEPTDVMINIHPYNPLQASSPRGFSGRMERKVYKTSPKPGIFVKDPFSATHVVTSIALLGQAFAKTRR